MLNGMAFFNRQSESSVSAEQIIEVPLSAIEFDPDNGRGNDEAESISELADSIRQQGVLQPIIIRLLENQYRLIAGERRCRAARCAGRTTVPAIVRTMSDAQALALQISENEQRKDIGLLAKADKVRALVEKVGNQQEVAKVLGKSVSWVSLQVRASMVPEVVRQLIADNKIANADVAAGVGQAAPDLQAPLIQSILSGTFVTSMLEVNKLDGRQRERCIAAIAAGRWQKELLTQKRERRSRDAKPQEGGRIVKPAADAEEEGTQATTQDASTAFTLPNRASVIRLFMATGFAKTLADDINAIPDARLAELLPVQDAWLEAR